MVESTPSPPHATHNNQGVGMERVKFNLEFLSIITDRLTYRFAIQQLWTKLVLKRLRNNYDIFIFVLGSLANAVVHQGVEIICGLPRLCIFIGRNFLGIHNFFTINWMKETLMRISQFNL